MIEIDDDAFLSSVPRWIIFQWPGHGKGKGWEIRQWTRIGRHGNCGGVRPALDPMPHESGWRLLAKSPSLSTPADVTPIIEGLQILREKVRSDTAVINESNVCSLRPSAVSGCV